jgi:hypothetical protein
VRWDHVNLTICNYDTNAITLKRRHVHNGLIAMSSNTPRQGWSYCKIIRWNNPSDDESDDIDNLREVLEEKIPEFERRLKESLK